jgi:hypothetical protein
VPGVNDYQLPSQNIKCSWKLVKKSSLRRARCSVIEVTPLLLPTYFLLNWRAWFAPPQFVLKKENTHGPPLGRAFPAAAAHLGKLRTE